MTPTPQFTAELLFHFREHGPDRWHRFVFNESCHRRAPMRMDGVNWLNTVGMWTDNPGTFQAGDSVLVRCVLIAPELFEKTLKPGVRFDLWEAGFFAFGKVLTRIEDGWPT
jgi:hypothetical protein